MAEELDPVTQEFIADMRRYMEPMAEAAREAGVFAADNRELITVLKQLVDKTTENGITLREMRDAMAQVSDETTRLRDDTIQVNHELDSERDKAMEAGTAMGHLRDEAAMAAQEVKHLGTEAEATAAKLDLMGLSGLSALSPMATAMGGLVAAAAAVAPAFTAMGTSMGAFAAIAGPSLQNTLQAVMAIYGAQQAMQAAVNPKQMTTQLNIIKGQWQTLDPLQKQAAHSLLNFINLWQNMSTTIEPMINAVIRPLIKMLTDGLNAIYPIAKTGGQAIITMLNMIDSGLKSSGFHTFLKTMQAIAVPATVAIMHLAGAILGLFGKLMIALAPTSVPFINIITQIVKLLSGPLIAILQNVVVLFIGLWKAVSPLMPILMNLATVLVNAIGKGLAQLLPPITKVVAALAKGLMPVLVALMPVIENALTPNSPFLLALNLLARILVDILPPLGKFLAMLITPAIARVAADAISLFLAFKAAIVVVNVLKGAFALLDIVMAANPIGLIIIAIAALIAIFYELWTHCKGFRDFWKAVWADIKHVAVDAWHFIDHDLIQPLAKGVEWLVKWIEQHWKLLAYIISTVLLGPIGALITFVATHWQEIRSLTGRLITDVVNFFTSLPGKVMHAVQYLVGLLYQWGKDLIQGAINGITSMIGGFLGTITHLASAGWNAFKSVLGLHSPSRVFHAEGVNIVQGLVNGIVAATPMAVRAIQQAAAAIANAGHGSLTGGIGVALSAASPAPISAFAGSSLQPMNLTITMLMPDGQRSSQKATLVYNRHNPNNGLQIQVRG